jgi:hypothetical protein
MTTILNTRSANRLTRRRTTRAEAEQQTRTALELRLLSLADANATATVRALMTGDPAALNASLPIFTALRRASMRLRTLTVQVPLWLTVFAVVAGSYALHNRGTSEPAVSSAPSVQQAAQVQPVSQAQSAPPAPVPFSASAAGSDRMVVPVTAGDNILRVGVNPTVAGSADWFWCLESDRPLTPEQHVCRSAGTLDPASGYVQSGGGTHVDAALATGASFFVQMYCPTGCRWQVDLVSRPAESATLP